MASQRYISTSFWDDAWIQSLDPAEKFVYLYLLTNPCTNIAGVYKITNRRMVFDTGYNEDTVSNIMKKFELAKKAYRLDEYIVIPNWPKHQKAEESPKVVLGIKRILSSLSQSDIGFLVHVGYGFDLSGYPSIPYTYSTDTVRTTLDLDLDLDLSGKRSANASAVACAKPEKKAVRHKHGLYSTVLLTDLDFETLKTEYPLDWDDRIRRLDEYIQSKGAKYKDHLATIRAWARKDIEAKKIPQVTVSSGVNTFKTDEQKAMDKAVLEKLYADRE